MTRYVFFNFPAYGHVNPTLAIVEELVARGEEVVYYLPEHFRSLIEATGATFRSAPFSPFNQDREQRPVVDPADGDKRLAMLPIFLIQKSPQVVPQLLERVREEQADCAVYDGMFLWGRLVARILQLPAVALRPSYAINQQNNVLASLPRRFSFPQDMIAPLNGTLAQLCAQYGLPQLDVFSVRKSTEDLNIVFLPRAFQPGGDAFDEHFLFVGPSLQRHRQVQGNFPFERLTAQSCLYISLGTVLNNQPDFYSLCFTAFGDTSRQVVLSSGQHVDLAAFPPIPSNFIIASHVPQLEVLARAHAFISHGGMNSVMESLYYGVPLIIVPQTIEEGITARRVQELGLGIAIDKTAVTAKALRDAVEQVSRDQSILMRVQAMQQQVREAGGYQRATDAIMHYAHTKTQK